MLTLLTRHPYDLTFVRVQSTQGDAVAGPLRLSRCVVLHVVMMAIGASKSRIEMIDQAFGVFIPAFVQPAWYWNAPTRIFVRRPSRPSVRRLSLCPLCPFFSICCSANPVDGNDVAHATTFAQCPVRHFLQSLRTGLQRSFTCERDGFLSFHSFHSATAVDANAAARPVRSSVS